MLKKIKELIQAKKLVLALVLAGAIAFFGGVYVSAQTKMDSDPVIAQQVTTPNEETPIVDTPVVTLVEEENITEGEETLNEGEVEEVINDDTTVTLEEAQMIAAMEHPGDVIVGSKMKLFHNEAVFKFYFQDGWKVYVRADDGDVVRVVDAGEKSHNYQNRHWSGRDTSEDDNEGEASVLGEQRFSADDDQGWNHRNFGDKYRYHR